MLSEQYPAEFLRESIPVIGDWRPYPAIHNREYWQSLPLPLQQALVTQGEMYLEYKWPNLPASLFLEYKRNGNRSRYQNLRYERRHALRDLILAECVENKGRFLDQIVNSIWATCEETYWGVPAHINMQAAGTDLPDVKEPTVDLFAAETVALLAWTHYLLGKVLDKISKLVRPRIRLEAERRVLTPCLLRDDFWWMGFDPGQHGVNNWNPWVNSNWLTAVLLLEEDPGRRISAIDKILHSLDVFIDTYADAGGCDEGPGYWGRAAASLFECLDQLYSATDGAINLYKEEKIRNMGRFIYRTHIGEQYYVNYADASAVNHPSASLVFRYGQAIEDKAMMGFGVWLSGKANIYQPARESLSRELARMFYLDDLMTAEPCQPLPQDAYFDGIQVMVARDVAGESRGFFLSAKGGHNAESHNHNDIGNFIVFTDGLPVIVDAGVETYTKKTFSPQRYEIWTMQSSYHSLLPELDGIQQLPGRQYAAADVAYRSDESQAQFTMDIASAYPLAAGLASMQRTLTLNRGKNVEITDIVALSKSVNKITLSLLTPCNIKLDKEGAIHFVPSVFGQDRISGQAILHYDAHKFKVKTERVPIVDTRMGAVWGDHLNRVVFMLNTPAACDTWTWRISKT